MGFPALRSIHFAGLRTIEGVTRDSNGAAIGGCTVNLFLTAGNTFVSSTISDANGNFAFYVPSPTPTYFLVGYLAGSPDTEGTTVNTLTGV